MQNVLKAFLEDSGYQITLADDGIEGIAAFHRAAYDMVFLDIMMPKLDGYTVCEMIRKEGNTPVILLTALDDEESQMKGFDLLADDYITKIIFSLFSLLAVINNIQCLPPKNAIGYGDAETGITIFGTPTYLYLLCGFTVMLIIATVIVFLRSNYKKWGLKNEKN